MKKIMSLKSLNIIIPIITTIFAIIMMFYLPETIPSHFNTAGEVDGYGSKYLVLILPASTWVWWFLSVIEKGKNILIYFFLNILFLYLEIIIVKNIISPDTSIIQYIFTGLGICIICLGVIMPKTSQSFFSGVRTSRTLSDDNTWKKTNEVAGMLFAIVGVLIVLFSLLLESTLAVSLSIACITIVSIVVVIYSYIK